MSENHRKISCIFCKEETTYNIFQSYHKNCSPNSNSKLKKIFSIQSRNAKKRNINFLLTFEEWCNIWEQSGHWDERGRGTGKYCMSRYGDIGAYEVGNVFIQPFVDNAIQGHKDKLKGPHSQDTKNKIGKGNRGKIRTREFKDNLTKYNLLHKTTPEYRAEQSARITAWWAKRRENGKSHI